MSDVGGDLLQAFKQRLIAVEQPIEIRRQLIHLVGGSLDGDPFPQAPLHDGRACNIDRIDLAQEPPARKDTGSYGKHQGNQHRPCERCDYRLLGRYHHIGILPHEQERPIIEPRPLAPKLVIRIGNNLGVVGLGLGECLDDLTDFAGRLVFRFPVLARLEIGRERLAARLHRFRDVHGEDLGVEGLRTQGFGVDVTHIKDTIASFRVRHRVD